MTRKQRRFNDTDLLDDSCKHSGEDFFRLAESYRAQGRLQQAAIAYTKSANLLYKQTESNIIAAVLNQTHCQESNSLTFQPAPFLLFDNYLCETEMTATWGLYQKINSRFTAANIISNEGENIQRSPHLETAYRRSQVIKKLEHERATQYFVSRLVSSLRKAYQHFALEFPSNGSLTLQLTSHTNGDFYRVHKDSGPKTPHRQLSFVYYFHQQPKQYTGGELRLIDTDLRNNKISSSYSLIKPKHNRLLVFPSQFYHEVNKVELNSDDEINGRHTLNGWHG